jgi:predicted phosphoadenosine phosphosulfate sulfurtransferase
MGVVANKVKNTTKEEWREEPLFIGRTLPQVILDDVTVYEGALERIRWIFDEWDNKVVVSNSGGKDSTIVVELAAIVAAERGIKLNVLWLDQECEFQATVDYQRYLMYERDDIDFHWYQIPFELENSTNHDNHWLNVWDEDKPEDWVRPKEPNSIHDNHFNATRWYELLDAVGAIDWNGYAVIDGIRGEESPSRRLVSRANPMYKWATWSVSGGKAKGYPNEEGKRFHPIHDWTFTDVWKAIHDHDWRYNAHYDHLHQYGISPRNFRVSNYHHESALQSLIFLQEIEPETWEAATRRLEGISTYGHLKKDQYPTELPYMFASWMEYAAYLAETLPTTEEHREMFRKQIRTLQERVLDRGLASPDRVGKLLVNNVIGNDFYGTHVKNFLVSLGNNGKAEEIREIGRKRAGKKARAAAQAEADEQKEGQADA